MSWNDNNIVIVKTGDEIYVDFGHYWRGANPPFASKDVNSKTGSYRRKSIARVWDEENSVHVWMEGEVRDWKLGIVQGADNFVVDSVNGIVPTDLRHLQDMIREMMR